MKDEAEVCVFCGKPTGTDMDICEACEKQYNRDLERAQRTLRSWVARKKQEDNEGC